MSEKVTHITLAVQALTAQLLGVPAYDHRQDSHRAVALAIAERDAEIAQLRSERENWRVSSICREAVAQREATESIHAELHTASRNLLASLDSEGTWSGVNIGTLRTVLAKTPAEVAKRLPWLEQQHAALVRRSIAIQEVLNRMEIVTGTPEDGVEVMATELAQLRRWKSEALEVEAQWNVQEVGRLLDMPLGVSIQPRIADGIRTLVARIIRLVKAGEAGREFVLANWPSAYHHPGVMPFFSEWQAAVNDTLNPRTGVWPESGASLDHDAEKWRAWFISEVGTDDVATILAWKAELAKLKAFYRDILCAFGDDRVVSRLGLLRTENHDLKQRELVGAVAYHELDEKYQAAKREIAKAMDTLDQYGRTHPDLPSAVAALMQHYTDAHLTLSWLETACDFSIKPKRGGLFLNCPNLVELCRAERQH